MWRIANTLRILVVVLITVFCALLGTILLLILWNRPKVLFFCSEIWSWVILTACGIELEVNGRENIEKGKTYIFVSNHESLLDIPAVFKAVPLPLFFLAKKELAKIPVMGWFISLIGMIFIDRGNHEKAMQSMNKAGVLIRSGRNVISFPEGTRTKTGELQMFRKGSFILSQQTGIDILPLGIEGAREALPSGGTRIRPGKIRVNIGKAIRVEEHRNEKPEVYANYTKEVVEGLIGGGLGTA